MACPQIRDAATNTGNFIVGSLTSVDVTTVLTPIDGTLLIAAMIIVGTLSEPGNIVPPAGWSEIQQAVVSASNSRVAVFCKISSGESGPYTFNWTNLSGTGFWIFAEYQGGNLSYPLDGPSGAQQNAIGVSSVAPSLTPATWNNYNTLVCVWAANLKILDVMGMDQPAPMTLRAESSSQSVSFPSLMLADLGLSSNASTDTQTATATFSTTSVGISFLIKQTPEAGFIPIGGSSG